MNNKKSRRQDETKAAGEVLSITNRQKCRRFYVFALWAFFISALAGIYAYRAGTNPYSYCRIPDLPSANENQNNGLSYYRYDPNTNRLSFMASASSLLAENALLGIFRTAAAKSVKIKDLKLIFCDYPVSSALESLQTLAITETTSSSRNAFSRTANAHSNWNIDVDLSNAREAIIDNFNCRFFNENVLQLGIRSRRVTVDSDWPRIMLRGHVIVTGPDGGTLESNRVKWDILKQTFTAEGAYVLKRGTNRIAGENICIDSLLNIAYTKNAGK